MTLRVHRNKAIYPPHQFAHPKFTLLTFIRLQVTSMDSCRSLSCSMILEVLATLCSGPQNFEELSNECSMSDEHLTSVIAATVCAGLVDYRHENYRLTKKGARTAIYLLAVNEWMDFSTREYRELMHALDTRLNADASAA